MLCDKNKLVLIQKPFYIITHTKAADLIKKKKDIWTYNKILKYHKCGIVGTQQSLNTLLSFSNNVWKILGKIIHMVVDNTH